MSITGQARVPTPAEESHLFRDIREHIMPSSPKIDDAIAGISLPPLPLFTGSALSDEYDAAIGLYGKFRQQIFQMLTL